MGCTLVDATPKIGENDNCYLHEKIHDMHFRLIISLNSKSNTMQPQSQQTGSSVESADFIFQLQYHIYKALSNSK